MTPLVAQFDTRAFGVSEPLLNGVVCMVASVIACCAALKVSSIALVRCAGALVDTRQLRVDEGEDALTSYQNSPGNWRWLCRRCGSQLSVVIDQIPDGVPARCWAR